MSCSNAYLALIVLLAFKVDADSIDLVSQGDRQNPMVQSSFFKPFMPNGVLC